MLGGQQVNPTTVDANENVAQIVLNVVEEMAGRLRRACSRDLRVAV